MQTNSQFHRLDSITVACAPCVDVTRGLAQTHSDPIAGILAVDLAAVDVGELQTGVDGVFDVGRMEYNDLAFTLTLPDKGVHAL